MKHARWLLVGVLLLSFVAVMITGMRGFFAFDHSIPIDGGYRIYDGQVPFRDFDMPYGTFVFYIQAAFFFIFGLRFISSVIPAALQSVLFVYIVYRLLRLLGVKEMYVWLGAIGSIFVYNVPFGSLWFDNTAFLIVLCTVYLFAKAEIDSEQWLYVPAGLLFALLFFSKQNAALWFGIFIVIPYFLFIASDRIRTFAQYCAGAAGSMLAAFMLIALSGGWDAFLFDFFTLASGQGKDRLLGLAETYTSTATYQHAGLVAVLLFSIGLIALSAYLWTIRPRSAKERILLRLPLLLALMQVVHYYFSANHIVLLVMFTAIILAMAAAALDRLRIKWFKAAVIAVFALMCIIGFWAGYVREGHDVIKGAQFSEHVDAPFFAGVAWPQQMLGDDARAYGMLYATACGLDGDFFVFPESTALYAVCEKRSVGRIVWYHYGVTYPHPADSMAADISQVKYVILERNAASWDANAGYFLESKVYFDKNFGLWRKIGGFEIYRRKGA
jgi:hypothetical protein